MSDDLLLPRKLDALTGTESLGPGTVSDFWRWALGDLRMNNLRGFLVEWLVARAVGDESSHRVEWGPWDVQAADGTLVEVKACGRLQSWALKKPSTPTWTFKSVRASRVWSDELGDYVDVDASARVHVWGFALHTATDPQRYNPLDVGQWEFRVMPHRALLATSQVSAGLSFFARYGVEAVGYDDLAEAVKTARRANDQLEASAQSGV
jgi:hypothetical protein